MSHNSEVLDFDFDDIYDDMPPLEDIIPSEPLVQLGTEREREFECYRVCHILAQIELASCFRGAPEPVFEVLGPLLMRAICQ